MKTIILFALAFSIFSPTFGQEAAQETSSDIRMGVARPAMERAGTSPANQDLRIVLDETKAEIIDVSKVGVREVFDLLGAELGVEWVGNAYHVWASAKYTGGGTESTFRVDDEVATIKVQQTEQTGTSSQSPHEHGVVPFFQNGEQKFSEDFAVTTLGDHKTSLVIAGRVKLELAWTIEPIVMAYACDAGGGTGLTIVEIYVYWFDQPPTSTENIELMVGGHPVTTSGILLDNDLMRINIFIDSTDYQGLFNGVAEWDPVAVSIETTGQPLLEREVAFPPRSWIEHC